jgi:hypothetical protein
MNYSVEINGQVWVFTYEWDAKHFAIDEAYNGVKNIFVKCYDKTVYRVAAFGSCFACERI